MIYKFHGILDVDEQNADIDIKVMDAIEESTGGKLQIMFMSEMEEDE